MGYGIVEKRIVIERIEHGEIGIAIQASDGHIYIGIFSVGQVMEIFSQICRTGWKQFKKNCVTFEIPYFVIMAWEEINECYKDDLEQFYKENCE